MKYAFALLILLVFMSGAALAQAPSAMNYQAVARSASGALLQSAKISLRMSFVRGGADGDVVYVETHQATTDALGQFSLRLGDGATESGSFGAIEWARDNYWLRVEIDEKGGADFAMLGASQLLSVPYAFYAAQAGGLSAPSVDGTSGSPSAVWHLTGNRGTSAADDFVGTTDNVPLVIRTNNIERLRLTASGKLGIGTGTPMSALDVDDNLTVGGTYAGTYAAPANGAIIEGQVGIGTATPGGKLTVKGVGAGGTLRIWPTAAAGETSIALNSATDGSATSWIFGQGSFANPGKLVFGYETPKMVIQQDGKVGIGILSPEFLLDVNGDVGMRGSLSVYGNVDMAGTLDVVGAVSAHSTLAVDGILSVANQTQSTGKDIGAIVVEGGVGIEKDVFVGGKIDALGGMIAHSSLATDGVFSVTNTTQSTSINNGAVVVDGGVGVERNVFVGGILDVKGAVNAQAAVTAAGLFKVTNTTPSTSKTTGALVVSGGAGIMNDLHVGGQVHASAMFVSGYGSGHIASFENTNGVGGDGISIKISNTDVNAENNYVTFYSTNAELPLTGRIEGYQAEQNEYLNTILGIIEGTGTTLGTRSLWAAGAEYLRSTLLNPATFFGSGGLLEFNWDAFRLPSLVIRSITDWDFDEGKLPSVDNPLLKLNFPPARMTAELPVEFRNLICSAVNDDWKSLLQTDLVSLATAAARMQLESECKDGGVTYGSKGADYAEWLPKADPAAKFVFGQIVGVTGGKISLETDNAEQIMSISMAPVVIGNIPPVGKESEYEKVAFIGQVPVMVRGRVAAGDYIVASGRNDGFGIGVRPEDLTLEQLPQILGRSLTATTGGRFDVVTVLVGVKTNEWVELFKRQHDRIGALEAQLNQIAGERAAEKEASDQLRTDVELIKAQIGEARGTAPRTNRTNVR